MNNKKIEEIKEAIENDKERYENFTLLEVPLKFNEWQYNKNIDYVQIHSTQIFEIKGKKYITGFAGAFRWNNNEIISLDGDIYNPEMTIYGYEYFSNEEEGIINGLEILVGNDW